MPYQVEWDEDAGQVVRLLRVVDPVMAAEVLAAADLLASNPIAHGTRVTRLGYSGMQYRFRVRPRRDRGDVHLPP